MVLEALACGVPVITTKGTLWEELNTRNAGWWIDIGVQPLVKALQEAFQLPEEQRKRMGANGRKLVEEKYSIEAVASQMIELYKWILNNNNNKSFWIYSIIRLWSSRKKMVSNGQGNGEVRS